ncbi:ribonuclease E [Burkholderia stagnalis]|uniref:flagellar hook-length control protein FliK n=1 Tax=Burkholderia stagnalis TaxID=1503054 RepID=UPI0007538B44|nr:flagellar hook-length control protein FliK [Burkholderia stagnalis]KVO47390.1 ribonuclease E [Burkholderia stagnalis]KVO79761.1 ribonuclease E [Burkholderia stagnalis]KVW55873.1 ribonuclease E [Burkholderia stagnalis]KVW71679.1 ribonuclease E [Burkholderia stagnalis]KVX76818.1 ribonuclease E [Burkholderia stagnalis]
MTGIDSVAAALLASRLDSLLNGVVTPPAGGAATAQVGTSATGAPLAPATPPPAATPPQASAQTALSEVGLTLDAISRFGGDATPAVVGRAPLLADPTVLLTDSTPATASAGSVAPQDAARAAASQAAAPARDATAAAPVLALRAALAQAVSESGLFYESHLAQWLAGQRPLAALEREPQARLPATPTPAAANPPPDNADSTLDALLDARLPLPSPAPRTAGQPGPGTPAGAAPHANAAVPARDFLAPDAPPPRIAGGTGPHPDTPESRWTPARAALAGAASADTPASAPLPVHPAAVPLVRQQLDVLATDQFRWIGEAWPGARLDWTIEPDGSGGHAPRDDAGDGIAWRTRLTLMLPTLGTVDAELVLNGGQLVARLRANEAGAGRLARNEAALRQRLEASGLQLGGLSIRAVDGAPDGFDAFAVKAAAAAYARGVADEVVDAGRDVGADERGPR